jgi:hypothetical protein
MTLWKEVIAYVSLMTRTEEKMTPPTIPVLLHVFIAHERVYLVVV